MATAPASDVPPTPVLTLNSSEFCRRSGGRVLEGHPTQCVGSASTFPDPASCAVGGPNVQQWRPGVGCTFDMVAGCINIPTYESWSWRGDDLLCRYGVGIDMCGSAAEAPPPTDQSAFAPAPK